MLSIALLLDEIETSWFDWDINTELKCYSLSHAPQMLCMNV